VLAPGAAARAGRVAAVAGMRSWQGRGGAGVLAAVRRLVRTESSSGVVDDGRSAARAWSGAGAARVRQERRRIPHFTGRETRGPLERCSKFGPRNFPGHPETVFWGLIGTRRPFTTFGASSTHENLLLALCIFVPVLLSGTKCR
jgi:hypothetical protein